MRICIHKQLSNTSSSRTHACHTCPASVSNPAASEEDASCNHGNSIPQYPTCTWFSSRGEGFSSQAIPGLNGLLALATPVLTRFGAGAIPKTPAVWELTTQGAQQCLRLSCVYQTYLTTHGARLSQHTTFQALESCSFPDLRPLSGV